MARPRLLHIIVLALLFARGTLAKPIYPVSARLTLAPQAEQRCFALEQGEDCGVIEIVQTAFAATAARMFNSGAAPDLQLVLRVKRGELVRLAGLQAELAIDVRVLSPAGDFLDEMEVFGDALLLEPSPESLAHAEQEAASAAASRFERAYANSTKIGDYLVAKKVAPASAVAVQERGDKNFWLTLGGGAALGGGDSSTSFAPSLRVAGSYRWFFAQAMFSYYSSSFQGVQTTSLGGTRVEVTTRDDSQLSTIDLGLEAGMVISLARSVELRLGPGVHYLAGSGTVNEEIVTSNSVPAPESYGIASLTAFASLSTSFIAFHGGPRVLLGAEARGYFLSSVDLPTMGRSVPAASSSIGVFLGLEWSRSSHAGGAQ